MTAQSRAIVRIMQICATAAPDDRSVRVAILNEIRPAVAFDASVWVLTDPETEVGCSPLADVPCLPELPRLIMLKYLTPTNRWTRMKGPVARLHESTAGRMERSLVWNSLLRRYGVTDVASTVFRNRQGCWGFLDLWRVNASEPFTESESGFLASIVKPVTEALQRSQADTFKLTARTVPRAGPAVLILSPDLGVMTQTAETDEYLRLLIPPDQERQPIPAAAYNVGAQLLAAEAGVDQHPPWARVHLSDGVWLTLRAARLGAPERADNRDKEVTNGAIGSLLQSLRAERARGRAPQASDSGRRHAPHRSEDVRVREHGPRPPEVHFREDRDKQPPHPNGACGRSVGASGAISAGRSEPGHRSVPRISLRCTDRRSVTGLKSRSRTAATCLAPGRGQSVHAAVGHTRSGRAASQRSILSRSNWPLSL